MKTELCAYSVEACLCAARLGVNRVELCASPAEGGVTPSVATIERVARIEGCLRTVHIFAIVYTKSPFQAAETRENIFNLLLES